MRGSIIRNGNKDQICSLPSVMSFSIVRTFLGYVQEDNVVIALLTSLAKAQGLELVFI